MIRPMTALWMCLLLSGTGVQVPLPPAAQRGPALDQPLPAFEAPDQDGRLQSFETLRGPKGLVLILVQSADW